MIDPTKDQRIQMVTSLSEAIHNRWREAQLDVAADDVVKAGLAALEFLEAALDEQSPWDLAGIFELPTLEPASPLGIPSHTKLA